MSRYLELIFFKFLLIALGLIYVYYAFKFPLLPLEEGYGPGLYPIIVSIFLLIFLTRDILNFNDYKFKFLLSENTKILTFLLITLVPLFFIKYLGFYLYVIILLSYFNFVLKISFFKNALILIITLIFIHLVFVKIFSLSFPKNFLF